VNPWDPRTWTPELQFLFHERAAIMHEGSSTGLSWEEAERMAMADVWICEVP